MSNDISNFVRVRCDLSGAETTVTWSGTIHAMQKDERAKHLFNVEGFNVARFDADTRTLLTKEVMVYTDTVTGEIIGRTDELDGTQSWLNPMSGRQERVVHVWNDPVCVPLYPVKPLKLGDQLVWNVHVPLKYPLPDGTMYVANEIFHFKASEADMELDCAPATFSWVRTGPPLPWMNCDTESDTAWTLLYNCVGWKVGGVEDIPQKLRAYVGEMGRDDFFRAPSQVTPPQANMSSWKYYSQLQQSEK